MTTVLIVDDEEVIRLLISDILSDEGFKVHTANDGKQGLEAAQTLRPDLILLDMAMPQMTGFEVVRRLKRDEATRRIPILAVTAADTQADLDELYESGCDRHLSKPIRPDMLLEKVKELLP
ncbi:response regulator [Magnetospira sp. QH-2]|uniref:response regulator n=1 Tax=Magnetospira sp. (strain QH-2) TaxID=1288970 RepID=UPI0003E810CE|nr:response regulator [Magnetospira sp. QH-2]CCQ75226.1 putative response regulator receiver protein(similar to polar-differentiation response regulator divK from Brucella abortus) [Magnetospira sp. QH-2]